MCELCIYVGLERLRHCLEFLGQVNEVYVLDMGIIWCSEGFDNAKDISTTDSRISDTDDFKRSTRGVW